MNLVKSNILKITIFLLSTLFATASIAEAPPFFGCQSKGCIGIVGSIYVRNDGVVKIKAPDGANTSSLNCTLTGGYFSLKESHSRFKEIYSMVLSAQISQKNVYLRAIENSSDCEVYYAVIYP